MPPFHCLKIGVSHTAPIGLTQTATLGVTHTDFEVVEQDLMEDWWISYTNSAPIVTVGLMPQTDTLFTCNFQFDQDYLNCAAFQNSPKIYVFGIKIRKIM